MSKELEKGKIEVKGLLRIYSCDPRMKTLKPLINVLAVRLKRRCVSLVCDIIMYLSFIYVKSRVTIMYR